MSITKEKWSIEKELNAYHIKAESGEDIAVVYEYETENEQSNAKLIAAAPELLEMLKALVGASIDNADHYLRATNDAERVIASVENV